MASKKISAFALNGGMYPALYSSQDNGSADMYTAAFLRPLQKWVGQPKWKINSDSSSNSSSNSSMPALATSTAATKAKPKGKGKGKTTNSNTQIADPNTAFEDSNSGPESPFDRGIGNSVSKNLVIYQKDVDALKQLFIDGKNILRKGPKSSATQFTQAQKQLVALVDTGATLLKKVIKQQTPALFTGFKPAPYE